MEFVKPYTDREFKIICSTDATDEEKRFEAIRTVYDHIIIDPALADVAYKMLRDYINDNTPKTFTEYVKYLSKVSIHPFKEVTMHSDVLEMFVAEIGDELEEIIRDTKLRGITFNGLATMISGYVWKKDDKFIERPEFMYMRVALASVPEMKIGAAKEKYVGSLAHYVDDPKMRTIEHIRLTYKLLAEGYLSAASPTLFNAMRKRQQMISCFLAPIDDDSTEGILDGHAECSHLSRNGAGIGTLYTKLRCGGSPITGGGGAGGIVPVAGMMDKACKMFDQNGNRKGAWAAYLEPWHADIFEFCELRRTDGSDDMRARQMFNGVMMNDLFIQRVREEIVDGKDVWWSLMCPNQCPGLVEAYGEAFQALYETYEDEGKYRSRIRPSKLWSHIITASAETGTYILFKDACNMKSNEKHLGTITMSNLCTEILRVVDAEHTGVCVLDSIVLPSFLEGTEFNFDLLRKVMRHSNMYLDTLIDNNYYPTSASRNGAMRSRPLGQGVQGLADLFARMGLVWGSAEAIELQSRITETMLYGSLDASADRAEALGPCPAFKGSPASNGRLQPDMWGFHPEDKHNKWSAVYAKIKKHGLRNIDQTALMPTASSAIFRGLAAAFYPFRTLVQNRKTMAGDFVEVNPTLLNYLVKKFDNPVDREVVFNKIVSAGNSIQNIPELEEVAAIFKTAFEIPPITQTDHLDAMKYWVDQTWSATLYIPKQDENGHHYKAMIASTIMDRWSRGFKHGIYYTKLFDKDGGLEFKTERLSDSKTSEDEEPSFAKEIMDGFTSIISGAFGDITASGVTESVVSTIDLWSQKPEVCRMEEGCAFCE